MTKMISSGDIKHYYYEIPDYWNAAILHYDGSMEDFAGNRWTSFESWRLTLPDPYVKFNADGKYIWNTEHTEEESEFYARLSAVVHEQGDDTIMISELLDFMITIAPRVQSPAVADTMVDFAKQYAMSQFRPECLHFLHIVAPDAVSEIAPELFPERAKTLEDRMWMTICAFDSVLEEQKLELAASLIAMADTEEGRRVLATRAYLQPHVDRCREQIGDVHDLASELDQMFIV